MSTIITLWPTGSYGSQVAEAIKNVDWWNIEVVDTNELIIKWVIESSWETLGVLPLWNKYGWPVLGMAQNLYEERENIHIVGFYNMSIRHILATAEPIDRKDIKNIYSHPQWLIQCKSSLTEILWPYREFPQQSTTAWIPIIQEEKNRKNSAVICNRWAAEKCGLIIQNENLAPEDNVTTFAILRKTNIQIQRIKEIYLHQKYWYHILWRLQDKPGALMRALKIYKKHQGDILHIHSVPDRNGGSDIILILKWGIKTKSIQKELEAQKINFQKLSKN